MSIARKALAAVRPPDGAPASDWAAHITACWRASVEAILEVGRLLASAKATLPHGDFGKMIETDLPFTARTAQMLMAIAADPRLTNAKHVSLLPQNWGTLYELTKLDDETFETRVREGVIRPDMERADVKIAAQNERKAEHAKRTFEGGKVEDLQDLIASGFRAGAILADPPWHFVTRSDKGEGRSASTHYTTDRRWQDILELPVAQLAAPDATLHMWMVDWCPKLALEIIERWGFAHKTTGFTWVKLTEGHDGKPKREEIIGDGDFHFGMGYWTRANPEDCWLATRGHPKRINADVRQLIIHPVMEHSRKPDEIHARIERLVDGPYLELYARRERHGWVTWGNELAFKMPIKVADDGSPTDPQTGEITDAPPSVAPIQSVVEPASDAKESPPVAEGAGRSFTAAQRELIDENGKVRFSDHHIVPAEFVTREEWDELLLEIPKFLRRESAPA